MPPGGKLAYRSARVEEFWNTSEGFTIAEMAVFPSGSIRSVPLIDGKTYPNDCNFYGVPEIPEPQYVATICAGRDATTVLRCSSVGECTNY